MERKIIHTTDAVHTHTCAQQMSMVVASDYQISDESSEKAERKIAVTLFVFFARAAEECKRFCEC